MTSRAIVILLLALCTTARAADSAPPPAPPPPMFAAYYVWYSTGNGPHGKWVHWGNEKRDPDHFVEPAHRRDITSAGYPLVGPYDSDDPEIVRWHVQLAKAAGIRAFFVSWWGLGKGQPVPGLTASSFEKVLLPIAVKEGFKVALMDETAQFVRDFEQVKQWAAEYLGKFKDSPAYLKIDGKPVYYLYQVPFAPRLTPAMLRELKTDVEAKVGPVYWILDKISNANNHFRLPEEWLNPRPVDAYAFYGTFSIFRAWKYEDLIDRYTTTVRAAHAAGGKMMVPVHPGHDNTRLRDDDTFVIPRDDGRTLQGYLRAARDSGADYILLTSWNEWPETTNVEPSATWDDPYRYLKIVADFNGVKFEKPALPRTK